METKNKIELILSGKQKIGIVNADYPISLDDTIDSIKEKLGETKVHFVDYCGWLGSRNEIRERLLKEGYEIDDHHNGFNTNDVLTATSSVKSRQDAKQISKDEKVVLTFRPNFDGDMILSTYLVQNPESKHSELVEKTAVFSDCTMFGGQAMEQSYKPEQQHEILAFALNQLIYEETAKNFPKQFYGLKGFPAKLPGIAEAVLAGYETVMEKLPQLLEDVCKKGDVSKELSAKYLNRVHKTYNETLARGKEMIPGKMVYLDLREEPLDKEAPMPFWIAEGNGEYTKGSDNRMRPLVIAESKVQYVVGCADTRQKPGDTVEYDLTMLMPYLNEISDKNWFGKSNVIFGIRGTKNVTPEKITEIAKKVYAL